ncbi:DUF2169 family type VI secretion system accessory protein [Sorangium cellulosum]|uniref:DUF2169 domain-containing protein n=1 Tax=Sorangium cellulosum TaxID=56 RepID=A0A150QQF7_SORCE|nr:DUF2169 domain-containing protein [Sorangium cellulosum]KYF69906.1 hypothetical protein BE15_39830 [Sorangium cellulosum]
MDVVSACPLRVASSLWQPRAGAWALTIVCKATYTLAPGESRLAPEQDEPTSVDVYWQDDDHRSLVLGSDLAPFKRRADVLVVGHAHAPGRRPVTSLLARLAVGAIDKSIAVFGDRVFTQDGALSEPVPFVKMSLRWERAAGGAGTANPVGVPSDRRGITPAPNLEVPGAHVAGRRDVIEPVGFGPIAPSWPGRAHKLGWHAATWSHARWSEQPLPDDIDAGYFNAAPPDQQMDELCPDERIVLENLHPAHARLVTRLRAVAPRAVVERGGAAAQERKLRCDTLCIDTDRGTCSLTWRGYVLLDHPQQAGRVEITLAEEPRGPVIAAAASALDVAGTLPASLALPPHEALPFAGTTEIPPLAPHATPAREVLPFAGTTGSPTPVPPVPHATPSRAVLPFAGPPEMPPPSPPRPELGAPRAPSSPFSAEPIPREPSRAETGAPSAPPPLVEPPRLGLGPLAALGTPPAPEPQEPQEPQEPAPPTQMPAPTPPADLREPTIEEVSVEACAALDASLALRPHEKDRILREGRLDEPAWARLRAAWAAEIKRALRRGRNELLRAYDAAYVAQLERERGPISADELARITVGAERGDLAAALRDVALPEESAIRVQRTWIARIARDAALGDEVRKAVTRARAG